MLALVTGATGFLGANIVEALNQAGWRVRTLHRKTSSMAALRGLSFESAEGDVTQPETLLPAMQGCDAVFHAAAIVMEFWQTDLDRLYRVNVQGTRNVLEAAMAAGVPRLVHTSSQGAVGCSDVPTPLDEGHQFNLPPAAYPYGHSKHLAEQEVQAAVAQGLHAVIVNPAVILGPRDLNVQNRGVILDVAKGRIRVLPPGGMNVVDVMDVAQGHLLALDKGRPGERYLLTAHNVTNMELISQAADLVGVPRPYGEIPGPFIAPLAWLLDGANRLSPRPLPLSGNMLRIGSRYFYADNRKAVAELGFSTRSLSATLQRAVDWLREAGYL